MYSRGLGNSPSAASHLSQLAALSVDALTSIPKHVGSCYILVPQTFGLLQFVLSLTVLTWIPWAYYFAQPLHRLLMHPSISDMSDFGIFSTLKHLALFS